MKDRYTHSQDDAEQHKLIHQEERLRKLLRDARPSLEPSVELERRIADIAARSPLERQGLLRFPRIPKAHRTRVVPLLAGVALTCLLILALLSLPRLNRTLSSAAEVRQALAQVNTWHLHGWKVVDGKHVPWEIWGRRQPFFYWEQIGGQTTLDDGALRRLLFPPDPSLFRKDGIVITMSTPLFTRAGVTVADYGKGRVVVTMPTRQETEDVNWSYEKIVQQWQRPLAPWKQTPTEAIFNFYTGMRMDLQMPVDTLYTVDKQTRLPQLYEVRVHQQHQVQTIEYLQTEFNRPLPASLVDSRWPQNYHVLDATQPPAVARIPQANTVSQDGLTVQMTPLAMDAQGDVLVQIRGWLGSVLMDGTGSLMMQVSPPLSVRGGPSAPYPYQDEYGRQYMLVEGQEVPGLSVVDKNAYHLVFAPVKPFTQGSPLSHTLTITLSYGPSMAVKMSGTANTFMQEWLFEKDMTSTIQLPTQPRTIDPRQYVSKDFVRRNTSFDSGENLGAEIALQRSNYYWQRASNTKPWDQADVARSAEWLEKAIAASTTTFQVLSYRIDLAERYRMLDNPQRARQILHEVLSALPFLRPHAQGAWLFPEESVRKQAQFYRKEAQAALHRLEASP